MDPEFLKIVQGTEPGANGKAEGNYKIRFVDDSGRVEVETEAGKTEYQLKPLSELYGSGMGGTLDPETKQFMPLFIAIEQAIADYSRNDPSLTDAGVSLALDRMSMKPECEVPDGDLVWSLQLDLRLLLSAMNYSRQEVRGAIRKIAKSVERHTRVDGSRGYLSFIVNYV